MGRGSAFVAAAAVSVWAHVAGSQPEPPATEAPPAAPFEAPGAESPAAQTPPVGPSGSGAPAAQTPPGAAPSGAPPATAVPPPPPPAYPPAYPARGGYAPTGYYQPPGQRPPQQPPPRGYPPGPHAYPPADYPPPRRPQDDPGRYRHDGFYMRLGLGFGTLRDSVDADAGANVGRDVTLEGGILAIDLLFGGTPADGLVIGGGVLGGPVPSPRNEVDGDEVTFDDGVQRNFALFGLLIDWYPDSKSGLHFQGVLGAASIEDEHHDQAEDDFSARGGGIALGVGYEWFVGREWSLGVLGRGTVATLTRDDSDAVETHSVFVPSFLLNATYH